MIYIVRVMLTAAIEADSREHVEAIANDLPVPSWADTCDVEIEEEEK